MTLSLNEARSLSTSTLLRKGFDVYEAKLITDHLLDAELCGRKSHGLIRIPRLKNINMDNSKPEITKETDNMLHVDGRNHTALTVLPWSIEKAIIKIKSSGICVIGTYNTAGPSGRIGYFGKMATDQDLILIGFNSSPAGLTPHGSRESLLGTNPLTIGISCSNKDLPVILDMASSKMTYGDVLMHKTLGIPLPAGVSVDEKGDPTTDPEKAINGSQLPFENHKGSGLALIVELLAGPLVKTVRHGWGSLFILIDPNIFLPINEFKQKVDEIISEIKNSKKQSGLTEIYYPGERSGKLRLKNLESGTIDLPDTLVEQIKAC